MDDFSKRIDKLQREALTAGYEAAVKGFTLSEILDIYAKASKPCSHPNDKITYRGVSDYPVYVCNTCGQYLNDDEIDKFLEWDMKDREDRALKTVYHKHD